MEPPKGLCTLKKITDFQEFKNIYNINHQYYYFGNKKIDNVKFKELEEKALKKAFKDNDIYMLEDDHYLIFRKDLKIDSTIYYNDETPEPDVTEDFFIRYNLSNFKYDFSDYINYIKTGKSTSNIEKSPFINIMFKNSKEVYPVFYEYFQNSRRGDSTVRDLTFWEVIDILQISESLKREYIERVKKYYARYKKHISTYGYWVNR